MRTQGDNPRIEEKGRAAIQLGFEPRTSRFRIQDVHFTVIEPPLQGKCRSRSLTLRAMQSVLSYCVRVAYGMLHYLPIRFQVIKVAVEGKRSTDGCSSCVSGRSP